MNPMVYQPLIQLLHNPVNLDYATQALALKNLFVNQGFYNLFLATGDRGPVPQRKRPGSRRLQPDPAALFCRYGCRYRAGPEYQGLYPGADPGRVGRFYLLKSMALLQKGSTDFLKRCMRRWIFVAKRDTRKPLVIPSSDH
ncbi:hypothetical protein HYN43_002895 [Mucilaginibacter celer]|uniref:Uncharacterized protein n=1 Tax=Mucilaginibacter celer TaxID=2305508 RepID=A0A494VJ65_9SPHI|nr:hypothetical protein HYN43_002895 [Mucilaginibacter celer]